MDPCFAAREAMWRRAGRCAGAEARGSPAHPCEPSSGRGLIQLSRGTKWAERTRRADGAHGGPIASARRAATCGARDDHAGGRRLPSCLRRGSGRPGWRRSAHPRGGARSQGRPAPHRSHLARVAVPARGRRGSCLHQRRDRALDPDQRGTRRRPPGPVRGRGARRSVLERSASSSPSPADARGGRPRCPRTLGCSSGGGVGGDRHALARARRSGVLQVTPAPRGP